MATTGDWRGRWEEVSSCGEHVLDVWEKNGKPLAYMYKYMDSNTLLISSLTDYLIPKTQPPRPKQYRPYTEAELWDLIQQHKGVLWVKEKDKKRWISVDRTELAGFLFKHYTHLDGSPFGMEVEGE